MNFRNTKIRTVITIMLACILTLNMSYFTPKVFADEPSNTTKTFVFNGLTVDLGAVEYMGKTVVPVLATLQKIDRYSSFGTRAQTNTSTRLMQYEHSYLFTGNSGTYSDKIGNTEKSVVYVSETVNGINVPSNFKSYLNNKQVYIPYTVLFDILKIKYSETENTVNVDYSVLEKYLKAAPLNDWGRITNFNFKKDSVSTTAGKKAFATKYHLGGYAYPEQIPTGWDMRGYIDRIKQVWSKSIWSYYLANPPVMLGKDGSKPPYGASVPEFYKWLDENDIYLHKTENKPDPKYQTKEAFKSGDWMDNGISLWVQAPAAGIFLVVDGANDPYIKYEMDVDIHVSEFTPTTGSYTKMLLTYYLGKKDGAEAYRLYYQGWMGKEAKVFHPYKFGSRQVIFYNNLQNGGAGIYIGEPGFDWAKSLKATNNNDYTHRNDYDYRPGFYDEDPLSATFKRFSR